MKLSEEDVQALEDPIEKLYKKWAQWEKEGYEVKLKDISLTERLPDSSGILMLGRWHNVSCVESEYIISKLKE